MLDFISLFFSKVWELFTIKWPGFDFPIWAAFLGVAFAVIALSLVGRLFNVSVGSALTGAVRGGNNHNIKVAKARKDDTN